MGYGGRDFAGEPLYWAVARLIGRGGMQAVTVRAAAAEAGCSVGFMRHYYDSKSLMLACTYGLVTDTQLRELGEVLFFHQQSPLQTTPHQPLGPGAAAELLSSYLVLPDGLQHLVAVQLSFHALGQHDGLVGRAVSCHHEHLREICVRVLREAGVPTAALPDEALDLQALVIGLTVLVPGLASDDPEERFSGPTGEQVEGILRRHLEAALARHEAAVDVAVDAAG